MIILAFVLWAIIWQDSAADVVSKIDEQVVGNLSWFYMALVSCFVIFVLWVGLGRFGDIKLGKDHDKPEFSTGSWLAMLFAAGMGIGLVFWGVAEPMSFFHDPKPEVGGSDAEKTQFAMVQTFLHWGIHPWAIYVVVGLAVAYAVHRKGRPVSIRWALEPIFGDKIKGRWGDVIDIVAVVGTIFGIATSLGLGVKQIAAGLDFIDWAESSDPLLVILIAVITAFATLSVVSGVGRGIKWLSNINMVVAGLIMLFVVIAGPTLFVFNGFVQDIGVYLQDVVRLSFDTGAASGDDGTSWVNGWTTFYWGWWISWSPFVGIFIARISRGRTVREFVCGVLLVPTLLTFFWFAVFGGSGISEAINGSEDFKNADGAVSEDLAMFQLLDTLPGGSFIAGVTILLIVLFFVTSSDSGSYVVCMLTSGGDPEPPMWTRVFWCVLEGAVAAALLLAAAGDEALNTLKTTAVLVALPFSFVMIGMSIATIKSFMEERRAALEALEQEKQEKLIDETVSAIEGSLERNGGLETVPQARSAAEPGAESSDSSADAPPADRGGG